MLRRALDNTFLAYTLLRMSSMLSHFTPITTPDARGRPDVSACPWLRKPKLWKLLQMHPWGRAMSQFRSCDVSYRKLPESSRKFILNLLSHIDCFSNIAILHHFVSIGFIITLKVLFPLSPILVHNLEPNLTMLCISRTWYPLVEHLKSLELLMTISWKSVS